MVRESSYSVPSLHHLVVGVPRGDGGAAAEPIEYYPLHGGRSAFGIRADFIPPDGCLYPEAICIPCPTRSENVADGRGCYLHWCF